MNVARVSITRLVLACLILFVATPVSAGGEDTHATRHMVVAANPYAAEAGRDILRRGGSAVDAAVTVQLVLTLVEPQSSGIGGGAFMLHYAPPNEKEGGEGEGNEAEGRLTAYDGREVAPSGVTADLFADVEYSYAGFLDAVLGGRSVGVPGVLAMLKQAHEAHGRLPWKDLFARAIELAAEGFVVSPRLQYLIQVDPLLRKVPEARAYFFDAEGEALKAGTTLRNPAYAKSLRRIRDEGIEVFYEGDIAREIVAVVQTAPHNPGTLSLGDMAGYVAKARAPVCAPYRAMKVCGMSPPSSGGTTVLGILGLLEPFDVAAFPPNSLDAVHLIAEAQRLAYADRDRYVADSDFVSVPVEGLIDRGYLKARAGLISMDRAMEEAAPGTPPGVTALGGADSTMAMPSTSHFSIIDQWGGVVAMTTSVENAFGSRLMVGGFMLNNQLTDFAFRPLDAQGRPVANRVEPGKRPRSSMAPTIVFDDAGRVRLAVGSPGGNSIIAFVAKTLVGVIDWNLGIDEAIELPNFVSRGGPLTLEMGSPLGAVRDGLEARGHTVRTRSIVSGLHGISVEYTDEGTLIRGGADSRREGVALGD